MIQGIMQEQTHGMGADMRPLSVSENHDVAYTDKCSTSLSGGLIAKEVLYPPISVVRCSLSVLSNAMTPANDFSGGCHSGKGSFPEMTGSDSVLPEVSNIAKMTLPYADDYRNQQHSDRAAG